MDVKKQPLSGRFVEGRGRGSHTSVLVGGGCGQEEPGIITRVKLATGRAVVEKTGNCPHENKIITFSAETALD